MLCRDKDQPIPRTKARLEQHTNCNRKALRGPDWGLQYGYEFEGWNSAPSRIQVMTWLTEENSSNSEDSDRGISFSDEQELQNIDVNLLLRVAAVDENSANTKLIALAGLGLEVNEATC